MRSTRLLFVCAVVALLSVSAVPLLADDLDDLVTFVDDPAQSLTDDLIEEDLTSDPLALGSVGPYNSWIAQEFTSGLAYGACNFAANTGPYYNNHYAAVREVSWYGGGHCGECLMVCADNGAGAGTCVEAMIKDECPPGNKCSDIGHIDLGPGVNSALGNPAYNWQDGNGAARISWQWVDCHHIQGNVKYSIDSWGEQYNFPLRVMNFAKPVYELGVSAPGSSTVVWGNRVDDNAFMMDLRQASFRCPCDVHLRTRAGETLVDSRAISQEVTALRSPSDAQETRTWFAGGVQFANLAPLPSFSAPTPAPTTRAPTKAPTRAPTRSPTKAPTKAPVAPVTASCGAAPGGSSLYMDSRNSGWVDYSHDTTVDNSATPSHCGTYSMEITFTGVYGGYLALVKYINANKFVVSTTDYVQFWVKALSGEDSLAISLYNEDGALLVNRFDISNSIQGDMTQGWAFVRFQISSTGASFAPSWLRKFYLYGSRGKSFLLDEIQFVPA